MRFMILEMKEISGNFSINIVSVVAILQIRDGVRSRQTPNKKTETERDHK